MDNKFITILNFECKDCNHKIGQMITNDIKDEDDIKCPKCGSKNITYGTLLK